MHTPADLEDLIAECVHCGLCLDTCPTFLDTGVETESPRGRLHLAAGLVAGRWEPGPGALDPIGRCLGCRACETACPSGVRYGAVLETVRAAYTGGAPRSRAERWLVRHLLWRADTLVRLAAAARALGLDRGARALGGVFRLVPRLEHPEPPGPAGRSERPRRHGPLPGAEQPEPGRRGTEVAGPAAFLLRGCVARAVFPRTEQAMARLLDAAGYRVIRLDEPPCCGALARHVGETRTADALRDRLASELRGREGILVPTASGCGAHLAGEESGVPVGVRVRDFSVALDEAPRPLRFRDGPAGTVVYQDACHLRHGLRIIEPPRRLLRAAGAVVREPAGSELCCGSAGTYNLVHRAAAGRLGRRKADALRAAGAGTVVTANPGCAIQLEAHGVRVATLARFLESRLGDA